MGWLIIPFIILIVILGVAFARSGHQNYRFGEGLFKSSENNLEDGEELSDKNYYHEDGLFK